MLYPSFGGYTNVVVISKNNYWQSLSPFKLKNENGVIMENYWQFSKVYQKVPNSKQMYSRYSNIVIWNHSAEVHVNDKGELTEAYKKWREKGMTNDYAVRYPVGYRNRHECLYSLYENPDGIFSNPLSYIDSRKVIYVPEYCRLVKTEGRYKELLDRLNAGENLLIIDYDGPHEESLNYYKDKYAVRDDFIQNGTMLVNKENLDIMLNDPKHPFGHCYCLAMALLEDVTM